MKLAKSLLFIAVLALPVAALANGDGCKHPYADKFFNDIDTDHDGTISKEEFRAMTDKHFDEMDTDHDGTLSKEEMIAGGHHMMGSHMRSDHMMDVTK